MTEVSPGLTAGLKADLGSFNAETERAAREASAALKTRFGTAITELKAAGLSQDALERIVREGAQLKPTVGRIVHYVSYGTPGGEHKSECRAAIVTEVPEGVANPQTLGLCVLNPTSMLFNRTVPFHDGSGSPGKRDCPQADTHGSPFRYCSCGWTEPSLRGGTWHWPKRAEP